MLLDFYRAVLPAGRHYCLFLLPEAKHVWADSIEELAELTDSYQDRTGVYYAVTALDEKARKQANVPALRSFRLDIDAGPEKFAKHGDSVYPTQKLGLADVVRFSKETGLAPTYLISSGAGLHAYYCLDHDMPRDQWQDIAKSLQQKCVAHGLRVDPTVTQDAARILRPVGALHNNGNRVSVFKNTGKLYTAEQLIEVLDVPPALPTRKYDLSINDDMCAKVEGPPSSAFKIAEQCPALHEIAACKGDVQEPQWRAMLGLVKFTVEGDEQAHDWSMGHPDYDADATQRKLDAYGAGPTTCDKFGEYTTACCTCPHKVKIKYPIVLGRMTVTEVEALPEDKKPELHPDLERLNREYFVAPDGAGKTAIFRESIDPETGRGRLTPLARTEFTLAHENESVAVLKPDGGVVQKPLATVWLSHPLRRQYPQGMALLPNCNAPPGTYNLWRGFSAEAIAGDVGLLLRHVEMLCDGNRELVDYVLAWFAYCIQHPGSRPEVALVFRGGQGTGKGTLLRLMVRLFGSHSLHITQQSHLVGNFNAHLRFALFVFVDEGYWAGDKAGEGVLKGLITEPTIAIEMKGRDVFTAPNRLKLCMASNNAWVIPAGIDERRYCVIDVPATRAKDHAYFDVLNNWIDTGGDAAWLHYLLHLDISQFNPRAAPSTAALDQQKIENLPPLDRWILEALHQGTSLTGEDWPADGDDVVCAVAVNRFTEYCSRAGGGRSRSDTRVIGARLGQVFDCGASRTVQSRHGARPKAWKLPGLDRARAMAAAAFGLQHSTWN